MVKTRSVVTASSIRRRSAAWTILADWTYRSRRPASALWMTRQDREGSEGSERTCSPAEGSGEPHLPLQADRTGSWTAVAVAFQRSRRSRVTSDLCRDAAHAGGAEGADQQDRPQ